LSSRRATSGSGERKRRKPWGVCTLALPRRPAPKNSGLRAIPRVRLVREWSPLDRSWGVFSGGPSRTGAEFCQLWAEFWPVVHTGPRSPPSCPVLSAGCRHSAFRGPRRRVDELAGGSGPLLGCPCRRSGQCPACDRWFQPTPSTHRTARLPDLIANTDLAAIAYECGLR
jgi:hypothetical protein